MFPRKEGGSSEPGWGGNPRKLRVCGRCVGLPAGLSVVLALLAPDTWFLFLQGVGLELNAFKDEYRIPCSHGSQGGLTKLCLKIIFKNFAFYRESSH